MCNFGSIIHIGTINLKLFWRIQVILLPLVVKDSGLDLPSPGAASLGIFVNLVSRRFFSLVKLPAEVALSFF